MSELKHTPEPWVVGKNERPFYAGETVVIGQEEGEPFILAQCNNNYYELSKANARRIVTCVNACEGMDDPQAEIARLKGEVERLDTVQGLTYRRAQHAEAQLAELRARATPDHSALVRELVEALEKVSAKAGAIQLINSHTPAQLASEIEDLSIHALTKAREAGF